MAFFNPDDQSGRAVAPKACHSTQAKRKRYFVGNSVDCGDILIAARAMAVTASSMPGARLPRQAMRTEAMISRLLKPAPRHQITCSRAMSCISARSINWPHALLAICHAPGNLD